MASLLLMRMRAKGYSVLFGQGWTLAKFEDKWFDGI
jgi:hypothetical protein